MIYIFYAIVIYVLYQFVFKFVLPVYRASQKIKQGFNDIQSQMREKMNPEEGYRPAQEQPAEKKPTPKGDYIDFEEVAEK